RAGQDREPVRGQRRSARGADGDQPCRDRRPRRSDGQSASRALRALLEEAVAMRRSLFVCAALALPFALRAETPNVYAIRGARLVTAAGAPIESGTIVIRHGLIDAVGASVAVPPDATVIDASGQTVYPGLIDLGNTRAADQPTPQPPQNLRTTAELERWKRQQILKPQARAADAVKVGDADLTRLASAGVTSVLALPSGDGIARRTRLVNHRAP